MKDDKSMKAKHSESVIMEELRKFLECNKHVTDLTHTMVEIRAMLQAKLGAKRR